MMKKNFLIFFSLINLLVIFSCSINTNQENEKLDGYITEQYDYSGTQEHLTNLKVARTYYYIIPQAPKNTSSIEIILEQ